MQNSRPIPITRDLVLLGGGHAHALVLRKWAMNPLPGAQVTLVNPQVKAPYTGMLPGYVAGHYQRSDLDIDLVRLARQANARLVIDRAIGIDTARKRVRLSDAPELGYDTLSIDVGITSGLVDLPGAAEHLVPAKPLGLFANAWSELVERSLRDQSAPKIAIIGGGVAGVELALAMAHRLDRAGLHSAKVRLVEANGTLLLDLNKRARRDLLSELEQAQIDVITDTSVRAISENGIQVGSGDLFIEADFVVSAAGAQPQAWFQETSLLLENGYVAVDKYLQSVNTPHVFATGDCAHLTHAPRPKAGVFAVRQAPVLFENLRADLSNGELTAYTPQRSYLKLISKGRKSAVTDKWGIGLSGDWAWQLKDRIDRAFMDQFKPTLQMREAPLPKELASGVAELMNETAQPCGACGAKVGQDVLNEGLRDLTHDGALPSLDDAAIIASGDTATIVSTDHLRAFSANPYLLAKVAAIHALGDVWSMGAQPTSVLSQIILPPLSSDKQANMLHEIMAGAREVFGETGAAIVGGHTSSGAELTIGYTIVGEAASRPVTHGGAEPGDIVVLTKPIGTGVILAAEMRQLADGDDYQSVLNSMCRSQANAASILGGVATAMTDVTGFGLAGHLLNILDASGASAVIETESLPVLPGAEALATRGIRSTLWPQNAEQATRISRLEFPLQDLLFDPQTCGGLLATVPASKIDDLLADFQLGDEPIWHIGTITKGAPHIELSG